MAAVAMEEVAMEEAATMEAAATTEEGAIGAAVITCRDPTTTWRRNPTSMRQFPRRATGRATTGRTTTTAALPLRRLASASSSGSKRATGSTAKRKIAVLDKCARQGRAAL
jgi:hypothetical protein